MFDNKLFTSPLLQLALATSLSAAIVTPSLAALPSSSMQVNSAFAAGELLVKFRAPGSNAMASSAPQLPDVESIRVLGVSSSNSATASSSGPAGNRWHLVKLKAGQDTEQFKKHFSAHPNVEVAELNYTVTVARTPNDPRYYEQWGLNNIGQTGGYTDADIDAPMAWDTMTDATNIVVAVIDTGVDYTHEDLAANIWTNSREIPGNGIDDDNNGYVDDVYGYDFANDKGNPFDDYGHGTHVAGIIAAVGNNGIGVSGVAWRARLMALKFMGANGEGKVSDAILAVQYATRMGARILNNSWSGGGYSQALVDAIEVANQAQILFVASAGNSANNNDAFPVYPASYTNDNIVTVAATDAYDQLARFSNYGVTSVDLAAPGVGILSTVPRGSCRYCDVSGYRLDNGTSMAAPLVAGAAALFLAENSSYTVSELKAQIMRRTDRLSSLEGRMVSGGRLNFGKVYDIDPPTLPDLTLTNFNTTPTEFRAGARPITANLNNQSGTPTAWVLSFLYLSTDANITTNDQFIGCSLESGLYAGESRNISAMLWIPNVAPGVYYLGGVADFGNFVMEEDEFNNTSNAVRIRILP